MYPTPPATPKPQETCAFDDRIGQVLGGQIQLTGVLGVGAYGTVYRARDIDTEVEYAVKALNKSGLDPRQREFQDREIRLHYQASQHNSVVSMVKILDSPECTYVVLEYCPEGDLFAKITEEGHYVGDFFKARSVFLQILDAVRHCHSNGVYHRDLKPENILVKDNGWTVKLADFGLATQDRMTADFGCGSTFYMSPECQTSTPRPNACYASAPNDIWSLGVILVNLTCGRNPWRRACSEDSTFKAYIRDRNFLQTILPISDDLNYILRRMFELDPRRRASLAEVRDLIMRCPRFTQDSPCSSLPPTPPYSPRVEVMDPCLVTPVAAMDIPPMEALPDQQYPTCVAVAPQPSALIVNGLATPPGSNSCSPRLIPHTFPPQSVAPATGSNFIPQAGCAPSFSAWPRCGQFVPSFTLPRSACFWNHAVF